MPKRISRRRFLKLTATGVVGSVVFTGGGYAYATRIEPATMSTEYVEIPLRNLPPAFEGFKITHISDLHLGGWMNETRMQPVIDQVNELGSDMIAITGDFVHVLKADVPNVITRIVSQLQAKEGVTAVLGNHDHWINPQPISRAIEEGEAQLLTNRHITLKRNGSSLYIAGVDDIWEAKQDLNAALDGIPDDTAVVLLAHEPDYADEVAAHGRVGLQLSGHTHGGQVRVPFYGAPVLPWLGEKYDMGLFDVEGMKLYVNRGIGMVAPYVRFNCRPEITQITLRSI